MARQWWRSQPPLGRAKISGGAVQWGIPGAQISGNATSTLAADTDRFEWFEVAYPIVVDQVAFEPTTGPVGAATVYVGIYGLDTDWQPSKLYAATSVSVSSGATGVHTQSVTSVVLPPGMYAKTMNTTVAMTCRRLSGGIAPLLPAMGTSPMGGIATVGRTAAAFSSTPTAWTALTASATGLHLLALRWT